MRTVKEVIDDLTGYPKDAWVYSFEDCLVVVDSVARKAREDLDILEHRQLGLIDTPEDWPK